MLKTEVRGGTLQPTSTWIRHFGMIRSLAKSRYDFFSAVFSLKRKSHGRYSPHFYEISGFTRKLGVSIHNHVVTGKHRSTVKSGYEISLLTPSRNLSHVSENNLDVFLCWLHF